MVEPSWGDTEEDDSDVIDHDNDSDDEDLSQEMQVQEALEVKQELQALRQDSGLPPLQPKPDYTKALEEPSWGDTDDEGSETGDLEQESDDDDDDMDMEVGEVTELHEELQALRQESGRPPLPPKPDYTKDLAEASWGDDDNDDGDYGMDAGAGRHANDGDVEMEM